MTLKSQYKKTLNWIYLQKEGAVIGALIASLLFILNIYKPMKLITKIMEYLPTLWWYRLAVVLFIGISLGALADSVYKPKK